MAHPGGRPPIFKTAEEMQKIIDDYFDYCDNRMKEIHAKEGGVVAVNVPEPYTMSGLAYALGMDRRSLLNYSKKEEFFPTVKEARNRVQMDVERRLMETSNQAGAIFNLKNNFDWKDKTEVDQNLSGNVSFLNDVPRPDAND